MTERSLTITWEEPQSRKTTAHLSGLEFFKGIIDGTIPPSPISRLMGFDFVDVGDGWVVLECRPGEQHYNLVGNGAHGGLACTLLDTCMGSAIQVLQPAGYAATTLELKVNMVRPITTETGKLRCEGRAIHRGRRIATSEGKVVDAEGKLYAHGTTTMMIFPLEAK